MKKWFTVIAVLLVMLLAVPAVGYAMASDVPDDYIVGRKRTESDQGLTVTMPFSASVRMAADEPIASLGLIAVRLTVKSVVNAGGDLYCPVQFSVNDVLLTGESSTVNAHDVYGYPITVEQKWGNWFFLTPGFDGTLYLPCAQGTLIDSLTVIADASHESVIKYGAISTCTEMDGALTDAIPLAFAADEQTGAATDARLAVSGGARAVTWIRREWYEVSCVNIDDDMVGGLKIRVKDLANGGKEQDGYGWIDLDTPEFEPADGLAMSVAGLSGECYFLVRLRDENDVTWSLSVSGLGPDDADYFPFCTNDLPASMSGFYAALFFVRGDKGTVYLDYDRFVPDVAGATMGRIESVSVGMDHRFGLGRSMGLNTIANVDVGQDTVTRIMSVSDLDDSAISLGTGTTVSCAEAEGYRNNFELTRLAARDLNFDPGKSITMPLEGYLTEVGSIHGSGKGCGSVAAVGCLPVALGVLAVAEYLRRRKGGAR